MSGDKGSMSRIALEAVEAAWRVVPSPIRGLVDVGKLKDSAGIGDSGTGDSGGSDDESDGGQGLTELANDLASVLVRFTTHLATQVAKEMASAAGEFGTVVSKHPTVGAITEPFRAATKAAAEPQSLLLELPDASPGQTTSVPLVVRNDSLETYGVRLRCFMLLGPGGTSIPGHQVSFVPASVDVQPNTTATVTCQVMVPHDAKRAQYQGLIDAVGVVGVRLMVGLHVV